ncbi:MAG TPA: hypothetical protein VMT67_11680 [Terriglobales bacterium]|nr:hypothetical protein [Terriglobales bacterium]
MNANTPIHTHPLLGDVFELLHRMTKSQDQVLGWHAWDAIRKLQQYEAHVIQQQGSTGAH